MAEPRTQVNMSTGSGKCVLLVGSYAPSLLNFRGSLIAAMIIAKHRVVVAAPHITRDVKSQIQSLGAEVREVALARAGFNPLSDLTYVDELRKVIRATGADLILTYTVKPNIWGIIAASLEGKRAAAMVTGLGYAFTGGREPKRLLARAVTAGLYRFALRRAEIVLFQNPDDMALFRKLRLLPKRVPSVIVNGSGIDTLRFEASPAPEKLAFLMISRLLGDKGVREFGAAARMVKARHPEAIIRLVGYMDQSPDSITQAELDEIVASGVEFVGRLEDVRPAIAQTSVYVLPSYREGTPRSTLEAMAMGRAVITTDAPGCRETVVEGVNGYLVPPRDAVALASAMERFIAEPGLAARMGAQSRRIAEEKYDVRLVNAEIMRHAGLLP